MPTVHDIPTPALVIHAPTVEHNLQKLADYTAQHKVGVRPHTKTHKSIEMARRQLVAGCIGLTVAKVGELEVMAEAYPEGGGDLLLAYPALDPPRTVRVAEVAKRHTVRVAVDSQFAADQLAAAAQAAGATIGILVDLDTGMHRTGLQTPEQAAELAAHVDATAGLRLDGLFCYPGHVYGSEPERAEAMKKVGAILQHALDLYDGKGLDRSIVSAGSTPTAYMSHLLPQATEIRPGTYIYQDLNEVTVGVCSEDECAARIVTTVISDAVPDKCVLDAGSKTLTSDRLVYKPDIAGFGRVVEYPQAVITRLSEEHGEVVLERCDKRPRLGERVHVIPNHICPVVNLQTIAWLDDGSGDLKQLRTDARGLLS